MDRNVSINELIGTWKLRILAMHAEEGSGEAVLYPWGKEATGYLLYTADGYMSVVVAQAGRKLFAKNDIIGGSEGEQAEAARTYISYAGNYHLEGNRLRHQVVASLFPNMVGQDEERFIEELQGSRLVLKTVPMLIGGALRTGYITWDKLG